jgi:hypothetical protein
MSGWRCDEMNRTTVQEQEIKFDGEAAKRIREEAGLSIGGLTRKLAKASATGYDEPFVSLCNHVNKFEHGGAPRFRGLGDFGFDYLLFLAENGYNPYEIDLTLHRQRARR